MRAEKVARFVTKLFFKLKLLKGSKKKNQQILQQSLYAGTDGVFGLGIGYQHQT